MSDAFNPDFPITCPNCTHEFTKPLSELDTGGDFPCPGCAAIFRTDGDNFKPIRKAIADLREQIAKLGRTITIKL